MRLIDKYVTKTILSSIFLVLLMLTGLQLFILFVNQLGDLGKGDFGIGQAVKFILLGMPYQVYLFFPMASLLGCLIGLGMMANHRELVVMRAAGMSIAQVTGVVLRIALVLIVVMTLLGELLLPKLVLWANEQKIQALNAGDTLRTAKGVWLRHRRDFIAIGAISPNGSELTQVNQFHFNRAHRIEFIRQIQHVTFNRGLLARARTPLVAAAAVIAAAVRESPVVGSDETSARVRGKTWWQWVLLSSTAICHCLRKQSPRPLRIPYPRNTNSHGRGAVRHAFAQCTLQDNHESALQDAIESVVHFRLVPEELL